MSLRTGSGGIYNREMKQLMLRHAFQFVRKVDFYCRSTEFALAGGHGEDRRSPGGIKVRREWERRCCLRDQGSRINCAAGYIMVSDQGEHEMKRYVPVAIL